MPYIDGEYWDRYCIINVVRDMWLKPLVSLVQHWVSLGIGGLAMYRTGIEGGPPAATLSGSDLLRAELFAEK